MAYFVDIAGNTIVRTSGTVNSITSPTQAGARAIEFNSLSGGSVVDGNGKISFTVPSGIGTGDFTLEGWISCDAGTDSTRLPDYFLDVDGLGVLAKIAYFDAVNGFGFQTAVSDSTLFSNSGHTGITDATYFHFMLTRVSGTVRWFTDGNLEKNLGSLTGNIDGTTIQIGDLGDSAGHFRLDAFRISDNDRYGVGDGSPTSFTPDPSTDAETEDVNTVVLITGQELTPQDGQASLQGNSAIGDQNYFDTQTYVALSYFDHVTEAERFETAVINMNIESAIGDQDYMDTQDYVVLSYFDHLTDAVVLEGRSASLVIQSSLSVSAQELGEISISIQATSSITVILEASASVSISSNLTVVCNAFEPISRINPRYTLIIPRETRVNTITQQTRSLQVPKQQRILEFEI